MLLKNENPLYSKILLAGRTSRVGIRVDLVFQQVALPQRGIIIIMNVYNRNSEILLIMKIITKGNFVRKRVSELIPLKCDHFGI